MKSYQILRRAKLLRSVCNKYVRRVFFSFGLADPLLDIHNQGGLPIRLDEAKVAGPQQPLDNGVRFSNSVARSPIHFERIARYFGVPDILVWERVILALVSNLGIGTRRCPNLEGTLDKIVTGVVGTYDKGDCDRRNEPFDTDQRPVC